MDAMVKMKMKYFNSVRTVRFVYILEQCKHLEHPHPVRWLCTSQLLAMTRMV